MSETHPFCQFRTDKSWFDLQFYTEDLYRVKQPHELKDQLQNPPQAICDKLLNRIQGSIIGMALGDALGAHVEFRPRTYLIQNPVNDLSSGGTWGLNKGQFTDDTSMALCLGISLVCREDFIPYDQLVRYKWWYRYGYMSSTGRCFDIGAATSNSLQEFERRQLSFAAEHNIPFEQLDSLSNSDLLKQFNVKCSSVGVAGNGALMRLAPIPLFFHKDPILAVEYSGQSGIITHGDQKAYDACRYYGALIVAALDGATKEDLVDKMFYEKHKDWFGQVPLTDEIMTIAEGSFKRKGGYNEGIRGKGYIVNALEAALWAFWSEKTFEKGALAAVNLGDDTDTTAAIYGQLAGAYYGYKKLPPKWLEHVYAQKFLLCLSKWIAYEGCRWQSKSSSVLNTPTQTIIPDKIISDKIRTTVEDGLNEKDSQEDLLKDTEKPPRPGLPKGNRSRSKIFTKTKDEKMGQNEANRTRASTNTSRFLFRSTSQSSSRRSDSSTQPNSKFLLSKPVQEVNPRGRPKSDTVINQRKQQ